MDYYYKIVLLRWLMMVTCKNVLCGSYNLALRYILVATVIAHTRHITQFPELIFWDAILHALSFLFFFLF